MEAIDVLSKDKTVIMIAHRLKTIRNADRIYVLDHGKIVQQGLYDEFMQQDGIYKDFIQERGKSIGWKLDARS